MQEIKTSRVFWGAAVFAGIFYLVAKVLNIFVFENLFYPALIGFIAGAEAGFWTTSVSLTISAHKKTLEFIHHSKIFKYFILSTIWLFSFLAGIKIIYDFEILQISLNDLIPSLLTAILCFIIAIIINSASIKTLNAYSIFKKFKNRLIIIPILSFLSFFISYYSIQIPAYIAIKRPIYILYFFIGYFGLVILFSLLRLTANYKIASVAMGGIFGAFVGYLVPGWEIWALPHTIETVAFSAFTGGLTGIAMHTIGKTELINRTWFLVKLPIVVLIGDEVKH